MGEYVSRSSGGRGRASAAKRFSCILEAPVGLLKLAGAKLGGHGPLAPLNMPRRNGVGMTGEMWQCGVRMVPKDGWSGKRQR